MNDNNIDCLGISEINTYWPSHSTPQKIQKIIRGQFGDTILAAAHNQHNIKIRKQSAGCAVIARGQLAHRSSQRIYNTL